MEDLKINIVGAEKVTSALEALTKAAQECQAALQELGVFLLTEDDKPV
jgi:hypothetical protein